MDEWGWEHLRPWLSARAEPPVGPLFCIIDVKGVKTPISSFDRGFGSLCALTRGWSPSARPVRSRSPSIEFTRARE
jgi:hypothetical protein